MPRQDPTLKVSYENKDLIGAGSFITFGSGQTTLDLTVENDHLRLVIEFSGDETDPAKQKIETEVIAQDTLKMHFINFNHVLGTYLREPTPVATLANRQLWFTYRVVALQNSKSKVLTYSFYLAKEAVSGAN